MSKGALELLDVLKEEYRSQYGELPRKVTNLESMIALLHERQPSALCLSGGGIRSATFALGVIQAFAKNGAKSILTKFDYLSTVSGGGYIGAWLSAYARRCGGIEEVATRLDAKPHDPESPQCPQVRHLRRFSNYLMPRLGILSGDTWTLIGTYLRNLFLMWVVLVPLFVLLLLIPRLLVLAYEWQGANEFHVAAAIFAAVAAYGMAVYYVSGARPVGHKARYWDLTEDAAEAYVDELVFVIRVVVPFLVSGVALTLAWAWTPGTNVSYVIWVIGASFALLINIVASLAYCGRFKRALTAGERTGNRRRDMSPAAFRRRKARYEVGASGLGLVALCGALWWIATWETFSPAKLVAVAAPSAADWLRLDIPNAPPLLLYVCFGVPLFVVALFANATIFIAGASWFNEEYDREWWARAGAWCAIGAIAWIAITVLAIFGPVFIYYAPRTITGIGMITGGFAVLLGRSGKTAANAKEKQNEGPLGKSLNLSLGLAVPIFAICVFAGLSLVTTKLLAPAVNMPAIENRELLERSSWSIEKKEARTIGSIGEVTQTTKSIDFPRFEGDTFAARTHLYVVANTPAGTLWLVAGIVAVIGILGNFFVGVNRFSMNALYRNRLIRAYLGASNPIRNPHPFTGFDPEDNLQMSELRRETICAGDIHDADTLLHWVASSEHPVMRVIRRCMQPDLTEKPAKMLADALSRATGKFDLTSPEPREAPMSPVQQLANRRFLETQLTPFLKPTGKSPFHIINIALNLVSTKELAWQERKATSFTVSPLHCGSTAVGYRRSDVYGGTNGMSLGMATSISGAAASPNMGYHSSPSLSFLLALFNVRLGAWMGNPRCDETCTLQNPLFSIRPLVEEAFGATDDEKPYVYLSDGGHFENLGLYEMVRRRCHRIVIVDAGEDPPFGFEDLGNAIRKIRIDLGIDITIDKMLLYPRPKPGEKDERKNPKYCAYGTIDYARVDGAGVAPGEFVYVKPAFYGNREPRDIYNYAVTNPAFPHESTTRDQFFSESQFESYRSLGEYVILHEICNGTMPASIQDFVTVAKTYVDRDA